MLRSTEQKLIERSVRDESTGCLRWSGAHSPNGYGQVGHCGKVQSVHRLAHEFWIGPIPQGYEVDHVYSRGCRYRDCIEPTHLEAVTHRENLARVPADKRQFPLPETSECVNGHSRAEHGFRDGSGRQKCRICRKAVQAKHLAAKRNATPTPKGETP